MTVQLPPPAGWPRNMSHGDPIAALEQIEADKIEATFAIRLVLDGLARKHCIGPAAIDKALGAGYVADMLDDFFLELEDELARECDELTSLRAPDGNRRRHRQ
jgi:hypothetical protein